MEERTWVGVDIGGTKMLLLALHAGKVHTRRVDTGPDTGPERIEREVVAFLQELPATPSALGIAVPGLVAEDGSEVVACDVLPRLAGWRGGALLRLGAPMVLINDVAAALVAETAELADATAGIVMAGTGIGAAFLIQGRPLRGAKGWAGELGYLPLSIGDQVATLDALASGAAITRKLGMDGAVLAARAEEGDPEVLRRIREAGEALGLGLAAVVNLFNPELLVLEGGVLSLPGYLPVALESARRYTLPELWGACTVRRSPHGEMVVAHGAARAASRA
ncbi:MAG: ROK family protein [Gemmatimonadetes bacterium]|nr:ROK family protein [Gemmatimonadota bacterium]